MVRSSKAPVVRRNHGPLPELIQARLVNTISFYFSNLHEDTKKRDLWKAFGGCGKVRDIFIPTKRNTEGKKFGFVRFAEECMGEELLSKLDNVWVHSVKIMVNVSRFARDLVTAPVEVSVSPVVENNSTGLAVNSRTVVARGSFAAAVTGSIVAEIECVVPAGRLEELSDSVVGLLLHNKSVHRFREQLIISGMPSFKVDSLGGNQVLISSSIKGMLKESLLVMREWWLTWFKGFTRWTEDLPSPGRCVWLRVTGAPVHLWSGKMLEDVGTRFGEVLEVDDNFVVFGFGRVRVLIPSGFPVTATVNLLANGKHFLVFVCEEHPCEEHCLRSFPAGGPSVAGGGLVVGNDGLSDVEGWAEDVGNSSSSSADSVRWLNKEVSSARHVLHEEENILDKNSLLVVNSPPTNNCQVTNFSTLSPLANTNFGDEEDSDRRRKVSLDIDNLEQRNVKVRKDDSLSLPILVGHSGGCVFGNMECGTSECNFGGEKDGGPCGFVENVGQENISDAANMPCVNDSLVGPLGAPPTNFQQGICAPSLHVGIHDFGVSTPMSSPNKSKGGLGLKGNVLGCLSNGKSLSTSLELLQRFGTPQITSTPHLQDQQQFVSRLVFDSASGSPVLEEQQLAVMRTSLGVGVRNKVVSSSIVSPTPESPVQPLLFSRDAPQKRKRGRPKKKVRGRPKKASSAFEMDGATVSRQLFKDGGHSKSLRDSSGSFGAVIPHPTPLVTTGISSPILSIVSAHGEGDPTPTLLGVGTPQGTRHSTQLEGMSSPLFPFFVAPDEGLPGSPCGPSNSSIAKHILSSGKVLGVSFRADDVFEESRLVQLEVRDSAAKAALGVRRGVS